LAPPLFEGFEDRWKGGWPPLSTDLGLRIEKVSKKGRQVGRSPKKGRQMLASRKKVVKFLWPSIWPPVSKYATGLGLYVLGIFLFLLQVKKIKQLNVIFTTELLDYSSKIRPPVNAVHYYSQ
jgi:hypothetical protein